MINKKVGIEFDNFLSFSFWILFSISNFIIIRMGEVVVVGIILVIGVNRMVNKNKIVMMMVVKLVCFFVIMLELFFI